MFGFIIGWGDLFIFVGGDETVFVSVMIPSEIPDEFGYRERQAYLPDVDLEKADDEDDGETGAEEYAPDPSTLWIEKDDARIEVARVVQFFRDVFLMAELIGDGDEADDVAGDEGEDGVCGVSDVVDVKSFAKDDVGGVADEEDHAGCVCGGEF